MRSTTFISLIFSLLLGVLFGFTAHAQTSADLAQIDPSSALLLNSGSRPVSRESGVDSGRYTVRPHDIPKRRPTPTPEDSTDPAMTSPSTESTPNPSTSPGTLTDSSAATATVVVPSSTPTPSPEPVSADQQSAAAPVAAPTASPTPEAAPVVAQPSPSPTPEVRVQADAQQSADPNHESVSDDRRETLLEVSVAPGYLYNNSDSTYTYRHYNANAPTIGLDARAWFTPNFALQAAYLQTLSGSVSDSGTANRNVTATQQWFTAGVRGRKYFGVTRLAPSLTLGLDYSEYQFRVPTDAQIRAKLTTSGVKLSLESDIPVNFHRSWLVEVSFAPKLSHRESTTGIELKSGSGVDANAVGLSLGQKFLFDRSNALFWKLSETIEKDTFSGDANLADPATGLTPTGVSVTNSFTLFQIGYSWGH